MTSGPGANFAPAAFSQRGVIDDIRSKGSVKYLARVLRFKRRTMYRLGFDEKPSYITFKATLNFIKIDRYGANMQFLKQLAGCGTRPVPMLAAKKR